MGADWNTIHAERDALAADLEGLTEEQWDMASLCSDWTVHRTLGHMVSTAKMTPPKFLAKLAAARFKFHDMNGAGARAESSGTPARTLQEFRSVAGATTAPPGPSDTFLGEVLVHSEDIRRPLGISHVYPTEAVTRATAFYARSNAIIGGKRRVAGLTLKATDADWSLGSGPVVEGPALSLMLAATGRTSALADLRGPGLDELRRRS
ncbi:MAG: hypothetical protein QOJ11_1804 [Frankiales bacterium]|jgi:uncharacterized protein (TIGR03083 family)|nr:hypothetical protein [Frankiales bacterium]